MSKTKVANASIATILTNFADSWDDSGQLFMVDEHMEELLTILTENEGIHCDEIGVLRTLETVNYRAIPIAIEVWFKVGNFIDYFSVSATCPMSDIATALISGIQDLII